MAQWAVEFDMLKYNVLFEIIMLCASGVVMKNFAVFLDVKFSKSFRQTRSFLNAGYAHHSFSRYATDMFPEFNLNLHYWSVRWAVIINKQTVLQHVHNFLTSEFSRKCDVLLSLSVSSTFCFTSGYPEAAYAFFLLFFPSLPHFLPCCVQK